MTEQEFDGMLRDALLEAERQRWAAVMDGPEELEWTPARRRKMERLLRDPFVVAKRWARPMWQKALSLAACLLLFFSAAFGGVLVFNPMARAWVQSVIEEWTERFTTYYFTGSDENTTDGIWRFDYLPEGYVEISMTEADGKLRLIFENEEEEKIYFDVKNTAKGRGFDLDGEHTYRNEITLNGNTAYMHEAIEEGWPNILIWFNDTERIAYQLTGYVKTQELILMAETVYLEQQK